jgi:hypothetical protein
MPKKTKVEEKVAEPTENIEVLVETSPETQAAAPETAVSEAKSAIDGIEELKRQLAEEKEARKADQQARADAENRAQAASREVSAAKNEVQDSELRLVKNAIETIAENTKSLKAEYARALAAQQFDRAADIQEAMADNAAKLQQLRSGEEAMQARPKVQEPRQIADPVKALASQLTAASADWVYAHPEYARDPAKYRAMIGAHNVAVAAGLREDSAAYFAEVERVLGIGRPVKTVVEDDDDDTLSDASAARSSRSPPPAAPVSRSGAAPGSGSPRIVRLSPEEAEIARNSKMSPQEYWEQKQRAIKNGEYGRLN